MAKTAFHKPIPIGEKLQYMGEETIEAIRKNFKTQGIYPFEAYPGYLDRNSKTSSRSWRSSGAAFDSFYFQIQDAANSWDISVRDARIDFFFNYYMKFVDMGVNKHTRIGDVNRTLTADHNIKYMEWLGNRGSTQRPAIMMEFRHQARRLGYYMANRYKYDVQIGVIETLEDLSPLPHK